MPEIYKTKIIKLLKHADYSPMKLSRLAKALGVSSEDYPQFKTAFQQLRRAGHVVIGSANQVNLPPMSGRIVGTFRANQRGFGFVVPLEPNAHGDLFVPAKATNSAMMPNRSRGRELSFDTEESPVRGVLGQSVYWANHALPPNPAENRPG